MASYESAEPATATLRRSCHFCRSRKIRCSGEAICKQCKVRNLVCMYGVEGSKGRPKDSASSSATRKRRQRTNTAGEESIMDDTSRRHSVQSVYGEFGSHSHAGEGAYSADGPATGSGATTGSEESVVSQQLEELFRKYFGKSQSVTPSTPSSLIDTDSLTSMTGGEDHADHEHKLHLLSPHQPVSYGDVFYGLAPSLVQLISLRFGSLGFGNENDRTTYFLAREVMREVPAANFEFPSRDLEEAMPQLKDHRIRQLIDIWFYHHPLSFMLSKTLLLYDYQNGTLSQLLLAVILADTSSNLEGDRSNVAQGEALFNWVHSQLRNRREPTEHSLSLVQVLLLLGWHDIFARRACRGFCYILLAWKLIVRHQISLQNNTRGTLDRINGLDVSEIRLELSQKLYWFTFALTLWACLQMEVPFADVFTTHLDVDLPPTDKSAVFKLDVESGNISTLRAQERVSREVWQLGHITSTVASVYALYPHATHGPAPVTNECWTSGTLLRLRNLLNGENTLSNVCNNVRAILSDGVEQLMTQNIGQPAQMFVLAAYRTMIVHFLFPSGSNVSANQTIVDKVVQSVSAYEQVIRSISSDGIGGPTSNAMAVVGSTDASQLDSQDVKDGPLQRCSSMIVLGIDACSRALRYLTDMPEGIPAMKAAVFARAPEIATLVGNLHAMCKLPPLRAVPAAAAVKRSLRQTRQVLQMAETPMSAVGHKQTWSPVGGEYPIGQNGDLGCMMAGLATGMSTDDLMTYEQLMSADTSGMANMDEFGGGMAPLDPQSMVQMWADQCGKPVSVPDDASRPGSRAALMRYLPHSDGLQSGAHNSFNMIRSASEGQWNGQWSPATQY